ncbi:MAG: prolyl aminopeptidase [Gammaproteobacteria bacterium]
MRELYPEIEATDSFYIEPDGLHRVYVEVSGNEDGIPVVFLHGGPGSGCKANHRRYFAPDKYRIVIFDQRGCHRSQPQGECERNTTQLLIEDMEQIRERLGITQWVVFGGSWGATLGLAYTQCHPERVRGLILRGSFLARQRDLAWFVEDGVNAVFPDYWEECISVIPAAERGDLIAAFHERVHSADAKVQKQAVVAWAKWATRIVTWLLPDMDADKYEPEDIQTSVCEVKIETHYAKHRYFLKPNQLLDDAHLLPDVPVILIHGRKDLTCLPEASWSLHRAVPGSDLRIVKDGGHLAGEAVMIDALISATDEMAGRLGDA